MYNPNFSVYADRGLSADDVKVDMSDYASLWDSHYQGTFQIKDSMRDSYAIALLQAYKEEFETLLDQYQNGTLSEEQYNKDINIIFNNICHIDEFNELSKRLGKEDKAYLIERQFLWLRGGLGQNGYPDWHPHGD